MVDFAEQICLAVDQIVTERLRGINYDTTIIATIVDDSEAKNYKYTCSNGSAQFVAYSQDTTFKVDDSVQVTIPNNDYSAQKVIVGKYVKDNDATPYVLSRPFENLVDITQNLIDSGTTEASLLANDSWDQPGVEKYDEVLLWSKSFEVGLSGYNRLGLKGEFLSHIAALKPIAGSYGYRLEILSDENDIVAQSNLFAEWARIYAMILKKDGQTTAEIEELLKRTPDGWITKLTGQIELGATDRDSIEARLLSNEAKDYEIKKDIVYALLYVNGKISEVYLDSSDMYGNPYNFQTFFSQERVFDISSLGNIYTMSLYFYEQPGSFLNESGEKLTYKTASGLARLPDNLKTQAPYVCLGYDIKDFELETDKCFLFTLDGPTFNISDKIPKEHSRKSIGLRWLHKFENGEIKVVESLDQVPEVGEVFWYRYLLGAPRADQYSGVYWTKIEPETSEPQDTYVSSENPFSCTFTPEHDKATEQVKAIVVYNGSAIVSNILTFTNEREVANFVTSELVSGLSIWCNDNSYGNYFMYGQNNNLLDETKEHEVRFFSARFSENSIASNPLDDIAEISAELKEAKSITWEFPLNNTMITVHGLNYSAARDESIRVDESDPHGKRYRLEGSFTADDDPVIEIKNNKVYITRHCREDGSINNLQPYRINKTYNATSILNTVRCAISRDGLNYVAAKELSFGLMGTNGTDATLVIDFDDNKTALVADRSVKNEDGETIGFFNDDLYLTARLYDRNHQEVDFNNKDLNLKCTWSWHEDCRGVNKPNEDPFEDQVSIGLDENNRNKCVLSHQAELSWLTKKYFLIIKVTVENYGDYPLVAYKPIPIKKDYSFRYLVGPTEVIYDSFGTVNYYKGPYELYRCEKDDVNIVLDAVATQDDVKLVEGVQWEVYSSEDISESDAAVWGYLGSVENNILKPCPIYVKDVPQYGVRGYIDKEVYWEQPILTMQNRYPSSTLNKWDGKTLVINKEENYIVSPAIAAGRKEADNTFSGVMLGDWSSVEQFPDDSFLEGTGVYGFYHGALSYGFMETGQAFIGPSGHGRIYFNGESGTITSGAWYANEEGMFIDLDDGILLMQKKKRDYILADKPVTDYEKYYDENTHLSTKYYIESELEYTPLSKGDPYSNNIAYYIKDYLPIEGFNAEGDTYVRQEASAYSFDVSDTYTINFIEVSSSNVNLEAKIYDENENVLCNYEYFYTRSSMGGWTESSRNETIYLYFEENIPTNQTIVTFTSAENENEIEEKQKITLVERDRINSSDLTTQQQSKLREKLSLGEGDALPNKVTVYRVTEYTRSCTWRYSPLTSSESSLTDVPLYVREYVLSSSENAEKKYFNMVKVDVEASLYIPYVQYYKQGYKLWTPSAEIPSDWNTYADPQTYYLKTGSESGYVPCALSPSDESLSETDLYYTNILHDRYITLSSAEETTPLAIGATSAVQDRDFRVQWDGSVYINNGYFNGTIYAEAGEIGGWRIEPGRLIGGTGANEIELNSAGGFISGGTLTSPNGEIKLDGYFTVVNGGGYIGALSMNTGSAIDAMSSGVGMAMSNSCVKATSHNVGMSYGQGYLTIMSGIFHGYEPTKMTLDVNGGGLYMTSSGITLRMDNCGALTFDAGDLWLNHNDGSHLQLSSGSARLVASKNAYISGQGGDVALNSNGYNTTITGKDLVATMAGKISLTAGGALEIASENVSAKSDSFTVQTKFTSTKETLLANGVLTVSSSKLSCSLAASAQEGIYARFG